MATNNLDIAFQGQPWALFGPAAGLVNLDVAFMAQPFYVPAEVVPPVVTNERRGGDDVPRHLKDDERLEVWEPNKPQQPRDESLDRVIRDAYAKATGKPAKVAAPVAATPAQAAVIGALAAPYLDDEEEDDLEALLLSL